MARPVPPPNSHRPQGFAKDDIVYYLNKSLSLKLGYDAPSGHFALLNRDLRIERMDAWRCDS